MQLHVVGSTPRGRPKLRWSDVVKYDDLRKRGIRADTANNRNKWRDVIKPQLTQQMVLQPTLSRTRSGNDQ